MKNLKSFQFLMLMGLAVSATNLYSDAMNDDAVHHELQAMLDEQASVDVLTDLSQIDPMIVERIIADEADLEATFNSIKKFVHKKNNEIEKLKKQKAINEEEIARLAVELTHAQAELEKAIAKQRVKHKHDNRHEQAIKDALMKAEQGLKALNKKAAPYLQQAGKFISSTANKTVKSVNQAMPKKANAVAGA